MSDNAAYEYALAVTSVDPDIFGDEQEEAAKRDCPMDNVRLIFATCLQAAGGDMKKLHSIMGTIAGLPLREVARLSGISHEGVRIHLKAIAKTHPALAAAMMRTGKARVDALVPMLSSTRWKLTPLPPGKPVFVDNLLSYSREMGWVYHTVRSRISRGQRHCGYRIERVHKRAEYKRKPKQEVIGNA